jgi:hypothetical protein
MSEGSLRDNGPFDERHQQVWRDMGQTEVEMSGKRRGTAAQGERARGIGVRARLAMLPSVRRASHVAIADDELRLAMHGTRHETCRDQRMREIRNKRECSEALPDRPTKKFGPISAHMGGTLHRTTHAWQAG